MKTVFNIVDKVYTILNVTELKSNISGHVCKFKRPENSELQDVVIVPLTNPFDYVQSGTINVNFHTPNVAGFYDIETLESVGDTIKNLIEGYSMTDGEYFQVEITNDTVIDDKDQTGWSYLNLRIEFIVES